MPHCPLFGQNKLFAYIYELKAKLKGSVAVKFIFELEPSNFYRMIVFIQETFLPIFIKIGLIVFFNEFFLWFSEVICDVFKIFLLPHFLFIF